MVRSEGESIALIEDRRWVFWREGIIRSPLTNNPALISDLLEVYPPIVAPPDTGNEEPELLFVCCWWHGGGGGGGGELWEE